MQLRLGSILLVGSSLMAMLVACTQQTAPTRYSPMDDQGEDPPPATKTGDGKTDTNSTTPTPGGNTDNTCLGKANLAFDNKTCNTCMSDKPECCAATIECFNTTPDCGKLHACMLKCGGGTVPAGDGGTTANGKTVFTTEVYPSLNATCGSCHLNGTGGAPIFFAATADGTYTLFKQRNYHLANSILVNKGLHNGPALTAAQRTLIDKWVAAEATGGGGGGGGGNGTGGGNGMGGGDGGAGGTACRDACKAQYPSVVDKWQAYNTCAAVTCKTECL